LVSKGLSDIGRPEVSYLALSQPVSLLICTDTPLSHPTILWKDFHSNTHVLA
jgi:hypothetical protein